MHEFDLNFHCHFLASKNFCRNSQMAKVWFLPASLFWNLDYFLQGILIDCQPCLFLLCLVVFRQGDIGTNWYIVLSGSLEVLVSETGDHKVNQSSSYHHSLSWLSLRRANRLRVLFNCVLHPLGITSFALKIAFCALFLKVATLKPLSFE